MSYGLITGAPLNSILDSTARVNIWSGPVRSGKTVHSLIRWSEYVHSAPTDGELLMIGKTEATLERNVFKPLETLLGNDFSYSRGNHTWRIGSRTGFSIGANDEKAESKIRGLTGAGAYLDEGTLAPESFFNQLLMRLSVTGSKLFTSMNADSPYHWMKVKYIDRARELGYKHFTWGIEENTFLDPEYITALKREFTGLWYDRFILGLWKLAEGAVYDFFDEALHTTSELPVFDDVYVSCDYGTQNATVFLLIGITKGAKTSATVAREYVHSGRDTGVSKTDAEYVTALLEWLGSQQVKAVIVDPSAASFKAELRKRGFRVRDADNDVLNGIRLTSKLLKDGSLKIHSSCKNLIKGFSAYLWDTRAQTRGEDKPLKQNDHELDALRYGCYTLIGMKSTATAHAGRM